jgi:hypothetical protein
VSAVALYGNVDTNYVTDPSGVVTFYTTTDPDPESCCRRISVHGNRRGRSDILNGHCRLTMWFC